MQLSTAPALLALSLAACACVRALPSQLVMQDPLHRDVAAAADLAATLHAKHPAYFPPERSTDSDGIVTEVTTLTEISAADMEAYRADAQRPPHAAEPGSGWVWQSCGLDADVVRVDRVEVSPDPPRSGQNLTVKAAGEVKADVDEGSVVDVVVKLGLIRLLSKRFDLCEIARENDAQLQCPLKPGYYEIEHTVSLPRGIPPAKFNVHVSGLSQTELDLLCLDLSIDFGSH